MGNPGRNRHLRIFVATLLVGAAIGWSPLVLLPLLGLLGLALAVASPSSGVIASVPVLLFGATIAQYPGLEPADYADEAVIALLALALAIRWLVGRHQIRYTSVFGWIAGFLCVGLVSGVVGDVPPALLLAAAALALKGWLYAFLIAQVDWEGRALRRLAIAGGCVLVLVFAASVVNLAVPGWWTAVAGAGESAEYRWVMPSLIGPFVFAITYGQVLSLVAGSLTALAMCLQGRARTLTAWAAAVTCTLGLLSFRRLALAAVLVAVLVVLLARRSASVLTVVATAVPLVVVLSSPIVAQIWRFTMAEYFSANSDAARTRLTLGAFDVAAAHFPFGAGFGRYGSFLAGVEYSPEYHALGLDRVWGLMPDPPDNEFLTDTFWPAVLGEGGFVGVLLYVAAVVAVFRLAFRLYRTGSGVTRTVALMTLTVWAQVLVLLPGGAVLNTAATLVVPFVLLGVLCGVASGASGTTTRSAPPDRRQRVAGTVAGGAPATVQER